MSFETGRKRILYVDDDELSLESLKRLLRNEYEIDIADNSIKALNLVKKIKYDAVLMDIGLSEETNGIELTQKIKSFGSYHQVPFIAITSYAGSKDKRYFLANGLDYYIAKPFFKINLLNLLNKALTESKRKNNFENKNFAESTL